jgi:hypothetical protein
MCLMYYIVISKAISVLSLPGKKKLSSLSRASIIMPREDDLSDDGEEEEEQEEEEEDGDGDDDYDDDRDGDDRDGDEGNDLHPPSPVEPILKYQRMRSAVGKVRSRAVRIIDSQFILVPPSCSLSQSLDCGSFIVTAFALHDSYLALGSSSGEVP